VKTLDRSGTTLHSVAEYLDRVPQAAVPLLVASVVLKLPALVLRSVVRQGALVLGPVLTLPPVVQKRRRNSWVPQADETQRNRKLG
tara:strand:+ start:511 stop:768 length:258 start_codon:yes stop_codon:yes gene_type:complete